jgi:hypothetical protein
VLEGEAQDALAGLAGDELDALHDAVHDNVLDARVLALCVLADQDGVDIIVRGLVADDGAAGAQVGKEVECATEGKVERDVALANGCLTVQSVYVAECTCQQVLRRRVPRGEDLPPLTARGPFRAILFFLMLSIAASGIAVLPSFRIGVTSQGSQVIGVYDMSDARRRSSWFSEACLLTLAAAKMSLTAWEISGPIPSPSIRLTGYLPFGVR